MAKGKELLIPVSGEKNTYISLEVYYSLGGMNYFSGRNESRGIYISASPITIEDRPDGFVIRSFTAFTGVKQLVEETKRKSDKRVNILFDEAVNDYNNKQGPAWILVNHVMEKAGLKFVPEKSDEKPLENETVLSQVA